LKGLEEKVEIKKQRKAKYINEPVYKSIEHVLDIKKSRCLEIQEYLKAATSYIVTKLTSQEPIIKDEEELKQDIEAGKI
jgi:hypothetical protein